MLGDDFFTYQIVEKSDDYFLAEVVLNSNNKLYEGHFPGFPVTPGVCQVQMVNEVLNSCLNKRLQMVSAKEIKFLKLINPNQTNTFLLKMSIKKENDGSVLLNVVMFSEDVSYLKMRSLYKTA
ncbi:MAG: hypothetical protein JW717_04075 [Marinilabiliaceae bacterium]|nr:hypothetical protein [Marinilabiliaceae bacterium]